MTRSATHYVDRTSSGGPSLPRTDISDQCSEWVEVGAGGVLDRDIGTGNDLN